MNTTPNGRPRQRESIRALAHSILAELRKAGFGPEDQALFVSELAAARHAATGAAKAA